MNKCYTKEVLGELPAVLRWLLFFLFIYIFFGFIGPGPSSKLPNWLLICYGLSLLDISFCCAHFNWYFVWKKSKIIFVIFNILPLLFILFVVIFCDNWELSFDAKNLVGIIDNPEDYLQKRQ